MGLTFQQSFGYVADSVYFVQFLDPGDFESAQDVYAILEVPEDEKEAFNLSLDLEGLGYVIREYQFDELIRNGYDLLKRIEGGE